MGEYIIIHCVPFTSSFHAAWTSCKNESAQSFSGTSTFAHKPSQNLWMPTPTMQHPLQARHFWHQINWGILQHSCQHPSSGCSAYASHYFACPWRVPSAGWGSIKTWYVHSKCPFHVFLHVLFAHPATRQEETQHPWQDAISPIYDPVWDTGYFRYLCIFPISWDFPPLKILKGELCAATAAWQSFGSSFEGKSWIS